MNKTKRIAVLAALAMALTTTGAALAQAGNAGSQTVTASPASGPATTAGQSGVNTAAPGAGGKATSSMPKPKKHGKKKHGKKAAATTTTPVTPSAAPATTTH